MTQVATFLVVQLLLESCNVPMISPSVATNSVSRRGQASGKRSRGPGGTIEGRVTLDGVPVDNYGVSIGPNFMSPHGQPLPVHNRSGRFELQGVPAGTWDLIIAGPGFVPFVFSSCEVVTDVKTNIGDLAVRSGHTLTGRVTEPDGRGAANATVSIVHTPLLDHQEDVLYQLSYGNYFVTTDNTGNYVIDGISSLHFIGSGSAQLGATKHNLASVPMPAPETDSVIDLMLVATGEIRGTIVGAEDVGDMVFARLRGGDATFTTYVEAGNFFVFSAIPLGDYDVGVTSSPDVPVSLTIGSEVQ